MSFLPDYDQDQLEQEASYLFTSLFNAVTEGGAFTFTASRTCSLRAAPSQITASQQSAASQCSATQRDFALFLIQELTDTHD